MAKKAAVQRQSPIRLIPYGGPEPAGIAVHGSLALALDSGPPPGRRPAARPAGRPMARPVLGVVREGQGGLRPEARLIAQLVFDVLAGVRPYHHLAGYTTPRLFEELQPLGARLAGAAPTLERVRLCEPRPAVAEVTAVARAGSRVHALALRLEHDRRWRCAVIETAVPG